MADVSLFEKIRIGIASPEDIRSWAYRKDANGQMIHYEIK